MQPSKTLKVSKPKIRVGFDISKKKQVKPVIEEVDESFYEMDDGSRDGAIRDTTGSILTLPGTNKK